MNPEAFWVVEFMANNESFGAGVVTIIKDKVFGGDVSFTYIGGYEINDNIIKVDLNVKSFNKIDPPVFPDMDDYDLSLSGEYDDKEFMMVGSPSNHPELKLAVRCTRRAELP